jgi:biopolymer transport protein ExbD
MGAKVGGASGGGMDEINVTPLIDVVLVLLIIFMVLTPITLQKMATELPPEDQDEPPPPPDPNDQPLMVAIYKDNSLALNLIPMAEPALTEQLTKRLKGKVKDKRNVFIDAHPDALYDTVVHMVDVSRDCGAERVGFADLKEEGPLQATPEQLLIMQGGAPATPAPAPP